jgi:Lrp/AsnC family transcriptional regulator
MDEVDRKILRVLMIEPDMPIMKLAERVNLSHTPCWRRVKRMEEDGVILGRALLVDAAAVGLGISVFAQIKLKVQDEYTLESFEATARNCASIVECFSMSGESDYLLRIVTGSISEYEQFLKRVLLHMPGVASVNSSFALKQIKASLALPL